MQMRDVCVTNPQKDAAKQKTNYRWYPSNNTLSNSHFDGRSKQRPEAGGNHYAGCKTEHGIQYFLVDGAKEKYKSRPQSCKSPSEKTSYQTLHNGAELKKPILYSCKFHS